MHFPPSGSSCKEPSAGHAFADFGTSKWKSKFSRWVGAWVKFELHIGLLVLALYWISISHVIELRSKGDVFGLIWGHSLRASPAVEPVMLGQNAGAVGIAGQIRCNLRLLIHSCLKLPSWQTPPGRYSTTAAIDFPLVIMLLLWFSRSRAVCSHPAWAGCVFCEIRHCPNVALKVVKAEL